MPSVNEWYQLPGEPNDAYCAFVEYLQLPSRCQGNRPDFDKINPEALNVLLSEYNHWNWKERAKHFDSIYKLKNDL